ncbi:MAG: hypothetical protein R3Y08_00850 [Rikenellaceae bacterium]
MELFGDLHFVAPYCTVLQLVAIDKDLGDITGEIANLAHTFLIAEKIMKKQWIKSDSNRHQMTQIEIK